MDEPQATPAPLRDTGSFTGSVTGRGYGELPLDWARVLAHETEQPYWEQLQEYVAAERAGHPSSVYPPAEQVFTALHLTPFDRVRVVILGQDPYPGAGQAHGLSFSVPAGVKTPVSLRNIFGELRTDLGIAPAPHGNLEHWAHQGVLLLNTTLTVRDSDAGSHQGHGWERFTDAVISAVSNRPGRVVFVLWGSPAQRKTTLIDTDRHCVIAAAHPVSYPSAKIPFRNHRPFSRTNEFLRQTGQDPIDWDLAADAAGPPHSPNP